MDRLMRLYRDDEYFQKLKEVYDKWRNHANKKHLHIAKSEKDICLLILLKKFTLIQDVVIDCLNSINFNRKESYKLWLNIYRKCLKKKSFSITYKKEYIRRMSKIKNRVSFDRALDELISKKMLYVDKSGTYFEFTPILSFLNWEVSEYDKKEIEIRVEMDISFYDDMIEDGGIFR